ncbi:unnamed protein product [Acanthoscelides obtectus]|uniref:Uncharacterized protein n=1 Tax=Acanthoscelides obtectus TaxID=200917 RepID=A0A9P0PL29_ACAOB|nr:unnamed protein product [Acanthoscelides obtectus]CAK1649469.1 hypothetical protein AOBTE_LOCUS16263 [Acanthoscelides obtectus]
MTISQYGSVRKELVNNLDCSYEEYRSSAIHDNHHNSGPQAGVTSTN